MFKIKFLIIFSLLFLSKYVYANDYPFPPYFFTQDIRGVGRVFDGLTVEKYISADIVQDNIKFINDRKITVKDKAELESNRNLDKIKNVIIVLFGITERATNMRMYPSNDILHKGDKRFDYNQYTRIAQYTALAVLHKSADQRFYYVQSPNMRGWVAKADITLEPFEVIKGIVEMDYLTVLNDNETIGGKRYNLSDRIPVKLINGKAVIRDVEKAITIDNITVTLNSLEYSDELMLKYINRLLGSPYDWGGKNGSRDCSSFTGDLFSLFDIWLPRNTSLQAQTGKVLSNKLKSKEQFFNLLDDAKPYLTLIFFKGHVFIYGGKEGNDYILFHAVNRLRNDLNDDINFNKVVKTKIIQDRFTNIWERVTRIIEVDTSQRVAK